MEHLIWNPLSEGGIWNLESLLEKNESQRTSARMHDGVHDTAGYVGGDGRQVPQ